VPKSFLLFTFFTRYPRRSPVSTLNLPVILGLHELFPSAFFAEAYFSDTAFCVNLSWQPHHDIPAQFGGPLRSSDSYRDLAREGFLPAFFFFEGRFFDLPRVSHHFF